jgi:polysaccharide deacetylase 2 family uncharacterized protein YibQ
MTRRRGAARARRGRKAKRLGPTSRLPRFLRLGISPAAALVSVLGVGILIGIALSYHLLQREVLRQEAVASAAMPARPAPWSEIVVPRPATAPPPEAAAQPAPAPRPEVAHLPKPPETLARSPFGIPRSMERPEPEPMPGPNAAMAPPGGGPVALRPSPMEPAALTLPPPVAAPSDPAWRRFAVHAPTPAGHPLIAILIDDVGVNRRNAAKVATLPGPLTLAYMTYADHLAKQAAEARAGGHELMLHFPMEPLDAHQDAGPNALETGLDPAELRRRLIWGLDRFEGYVGVNNHMGSRFTAWEPGMAMVMQELARRGLLFVDSRTVVGSAGARLAERYGVPHADRDVFLDNEQDGAAVAERLMELEAVARRRGMAIGIGHPHDGTIAALAEWLPSLEAKGFVLVPVSTIVQRRMEHEAKSAAVAGGPPS